MTKFRDLVPWALMLAALWTLPGFATPPGEVLDAKPARPHRIDADAEGDRDRDAIALLASRCYACHGPDGAARKAGLRLDRREGAIQSRNGLAAVVPGDPSASELIVRVGAHEPGLRMPPSGDGTPLGPAEVELLSEWIAAGANYPEPWSLRPPRPVELPGVDGGGWVRDPLDTFILAKLESLGLEPAGEASTERWLRRTSFALTGLPPDPDVLEELGPTPTEAQRSEIVDRLLASPQHAEHMTRHWLDLARYADSYGYQADVHRRVWPWRDWVIDAFARNLPYDKFLTWQIAGDRLPGATREQRLATCFNRLHRQTNEGGTVEEEFRVEYVADRVNTLGTAVLGMTLECARCHDHKYDPVSQSEYYAVSAFFDDIDESGMYSHFSNAVPTPTLDLPSAEQEVALAAAEARVRGLEVELAEAPWGEDEEAALRAWVVDAETREMPADVAASYDFDGASGTGLENRQDDALPGRMGASNLRVEGASGGGIELTGDDALTFPSVGVWRRWQAFSFGVWVRRGKEADRAVIVHRSRAWHDSASRGYQLLLEEGRPSAAVIHFWPGNAIAVRAREALPLESWVHLGVSYDGSSRAEGLSIYVDGVPAKLEVVRDHLTREIIRSGESDLTIGERFRDHGFARGRVDGFSVFDRELLPFEFAGLAGDRSLLGIDELRAQVRGLERGPFQSEARAALAASLESARQARDELQDRIPAIMAMEDRAEARKAYRLDRGHYGSRAEEVQPGTPACLPPLVVEGEPDRLDLARWLCDPEHPRTSRVAVNRLWQRVFGIGLVPTPEDWGIQGTPPSHPALLDHLAHGFIQGGWDVRALLKRMVLSATFRQGDGVSEASRRLDPDNRWLSRGPRIRLSAEEVRDQALWASGLLVQKVGGPSVHPYQPPGLWKEVSGRAYPTSTGEALYRRSLYTFWKRTSPPPSMMLFDANKRDVCAVRRSSTNTPLQALVLWNDPQFVEAGRVWAQAWLVAEGSAEERIRGGFRRIASRPPSEEELQALLDLEAELRADFEADPGAARALLGVGSSPVPEGLEPSELASHALVAGLLFAHGETLHR